MTYFISKGTEQTGPHSIDQIQAMLAAGDLEGTDLAWREGMPEWQPVISVLPPPPPFQMNSGAVPGMPPLPASAIVPPIPAAAADPLSGSEFLMAQLDGESKDYWDVIDVSSGRVVLCIREGSRGFADSVLRSGILDAWGGSGLAKYTVALLDPSGAAYLVLKGGGIGGHSEAYNPSGEKIGEIKRTSMINLHFEAITKEGSAFKLTSKGFGRLTSEQKITGPQGNTLGSVHDSSWSDAKKALGDRIRVADTDKMLKSKYTYQHHVKIQSPMTSRDKVFLFAAVFQLARTNS